MNFLFLSKNQLVSHCYLKSVYHFLSVILVDSRNLSDVQYDKTKKAQSYENMKKRENLAFDSNREFHCQSGGPEFLRWVEAPATKVGAPIYYLFPICISLYLDLIEKHEPGVVSVSYPAAMQRKDRETRNLRSYLRQPSFYDIFLQGLGGHCPLGPLDLPLGFPN